MALNWTKKRIVCRVYLLWREDSFNLSVIALKFLCAKHCRVTKQSMEALVNLQARNEKNHKRIVGNGNDRENGAHTARYYKEYADGNNHSHMDFRSNASKGRGDAGLHEHDRSQLICTPDSIHERRLKNTYIR